MLLSSPALIITKSENSTYYNMQHIHFHQDIDQVSFSIKIFNEALSDKNLRKTCQMITKISQQAVLQSVMVSTLYSPQRTLERHESDQDSKHVPQEYKYSELTNSKSSYSERQKHQSASQELHLLDARLILSISCTGFLKRMTFRMLLRWNVPAALRYSEKDFHHL